ncbi:SIR2 family protein [Luteimonas sp. 8-5]|uniref:SIR2 family protein n=1 Tax=Luteimonas sp. 8-5 TaxID=3039387 RepID=UPI002436C9D5|nr:SIR2 family protein [Luteimonas sp. 8-5]MDG6348498.1 SIR2 family protein [Luteimonas sp. 8-5]
MRFVDAGPDIPSELIAAQERGETLFVCGAGVSRTAGLPLFRKLVEQVYGRLEESWMHHPAEREGMVEGGKLFGQYDRVLRCLERRLAASESPPNRNMKARIRIAVRDELAPPEEADLSNHLALLTLSRDNQGISRLLTTNFDTLFERAWLREHGNRVASHASMALPRPMTSGFSGVLHLHGRLADALVQTIETDLVLTSAEFGDAYLRSGWASRYIYDLARTHTLVLVGYQADDPPMRYLLEALEADRELYPDLRKVYAFGEYSAADGEINEALWRAKGVEPILYRLDNNDHSPLYATLREWKGYQDDPTAWRREQLLGLLEEHPHPSSEEAIARCTALLDRGDASQLLGELSPDAAWLPILAERGVLKHPLPDVWIAGRINDPEMIRACAGLLPFDEQTRWRVKLALDGADDELTDIRKQAWRLMLGQSTPRTSSWFDGGWYDWLPLIHNGQTGFQARDLVADILTPRVKIGKPLWWPDEDEPAAEALYKLITVDMEPADHPPPSEILKAWPDTVEDSLALFRTLNRSLINALELASDLGKTGDWDAPSRNVPSVAKHAQNRHRGGFRPIVRGLADLWERIAKHDAAGARQLIRHWVESPFVLLRRLYLFALADESWPANEAAQIVLGLNDDDFWDDDAQVEIMRLLVARWSQFDVQERTAVEDRLRAGVPAALFTEEAVADAERWTSIVDDSIYRRIHRIVAAGGAVSKESQALLAEISARHPRWTAGPEDQDDFSTWHTERVGPDGHPELLAGVEDDRLVQEALRLQQEQHFDEGDLWRVFCSADPERALRGLKHESDAGRWDPGAWRHLLWAAAEKGDTAFQHDVAGLILAMPAPVMGEILHAATSWMARQREALAQAPEPGEAPFLPVWDCLANLAYEAREGEEADASYGGDVVGQALNRPGGDLASALLGALTATKPANDSGLGDTLGPRFSRLATAEGRAGFLGRVYVARDLAFMDAIAPEWTGTHLVPRLDWNHPEAGALWRAYAHGRIGKARLFNALKPALLQTFEEKRVPEQHLEGIFSKLLDVAIWHRKGERREYVLSNADVKRALAIAPSRVRQNVAWRLWRMMGDEKVLDKAAHWQNLVRPVLLDVWPLDASARGKGASEKLVFMALECGDALPDAVDAILDLIVPYQLYGLSHGLRLELHHQGLFEAYPRAFLKLANALIDPEAFPVPNDLATFLDDCVGLDAEVANDPAYIRLYGLRRQLNA